MFFIVVGIARGSAKQAPEEASTPAGATLWEERLEKAPPVFFHYTTSFLVTLARRMINAVRGAPNQAHRTRAGAVGL